MTDQANAPQAPAPQPTLADEQVALLRTALTQTAFAKYHELIATLKKLPIHQGIPGISQAYLFIDSGMLWFKEILATSQLIFSQPTPQAPEPVAPVEESKEQMAAPEASPENPQ